MITGNLDLVKRTEYGLRSAIGTLQKFYGRIFDWKFNEAMPGYTMIDGVGGIFDAPDPQIPTGITNYVNVDDLGAKEDLVRKNGGQIYKSKQEVPGRGWFTIFADPDGNTVAMWEAAKPPRKPAAKKATAKKAAAKGKKNSSRKATKRSR